MNERLRHTSFKPVWCIPRKTHAVPGAGFRWHVDARYASLLLLCGVVHDGDVFVVTNGHSAAVRLAAEWAGVCVDVVQDDD